MVGLGRFELPTSPLSAVRSNQLSYRPGQKHRSAPVTLWGQACRYHQPHTTLPRLIGGAGRDRTGDLLNANQALSQLSYSPLEHIDRAAVQPPGLWLVI